MTRNEAVATILGSNGAWFGVSFIRRTARPDGSQQAGEVREMVARLGVTKHLKGGNPAYDRVEKQLICCWDAVKKGYRSIPVDSIVSVTFGGVKYLVND